MIKHIKGDLVSMAWAGEFDFIMHGCNCFHTMGAGIAKTIKENFVVAFDADLSTEHASLAKLGDYSIACTDIELPDMTDKELYIVNLYTQYNTGPNAEYSALRSALQLFVGEHYLDAEKIGIPWIGAGIGGLDIELVKGIVEDELGHLDVTMVEFEG